MPRILIVDDDPDIIEALETYFDGFGWTIVHSMDGTHALAQMESDRGLDLVLLDVNLPDLNGFEVLERSQSSGVVAPVVMLSISAGDENRLRALGLGAHDYIAKPFDPDALRERIEQIIGLAPPAPLSPDRPYRIGEALIDFANERVHRGTRILEMSEPQRDLLRVLLENRGHAVSRKRLLREGLGIDQDTITFTITLRVLYESLDKHMHEVQQLVEPDPYHPVYIERVFGQGYRLRS